MSALVTTAEFGELEAEIECDQRDQNRRACAREVYGLRIELKVLYSGCQAVISKKYPF